MRIAGHAQVVGVADVRTEFNTVLAADVRPIVHELILMFLLDEGAVALVHVQGVAKKELGGSGLLNRKGRHGRRGTVQVHAWNAGVFGRRRPKAPGTHIHPVPHVAETDIRKQRRA